jgi:hypothetical protein
MNNELGVGKHYNQNNETTMNRKLVLDLSPKELELLMTGMLREKHAQLNKVCDMVGGPEPKATINSLSHAFNVKLCDQIYGKIERAGRE